MPKGMPFYVNGKRRKTAPMSDYAISRGRGKLFFQTGKCNKPGFFPIENSDYFQARTVSHFLNF